MIMKYSYLENRPLEDAVKGYAEFLTGRVESLGTETLPVSESCGRITAKACYARLSSPHYNACAMDGIAVWAADTFGASELTPVTIGKYQMVDTGDPLPEGFDAVVMIEEVTFQGKSVILHSAAGPWQHVRQIGEDLCKGDMILPSYTKMTPAYVGALLAGGVTRAEVLKQVSVGIVPTGDELIPVGESPKPGEIIEFNSHMLRAMLTEAGCTVTVYGIVRDKPGLLEEALLSALCKNDIVLINAGSSAGRDDYTQKVIQETGELFCHGIAIRPGKPAVLGICGGKPVVGLPGYPVSAAIVLEQVVYPVIELMTKNNPSPANRVKAKLTRRVVSGLKYQEFLRVKLGFIENKLVASPMGRGAGAVVSLAKADGVAVIARDSEGIEAGEEVDVTLLRPLEEIHRALIVTGSHDPILDVIGDIMKRRTNFYLTSSHVGSMGGIQALLRGEAHIAPVHLLDTVTGEYNNVERYFKGDTTIIKGVKRIQGIMVKKGNPRGIKGITDLAQKGLTYVNRQKGAGTRILLDFLLLKAHISPGGIYGYENEEYTHTAVAAQIADGNADAGLGIYSAAKIFGLDFIPVSEEEYDFLLKADMLKEAMVQAFMEALDSEEFKNSLKEMGGYER
jgi:putative molybdopterin biosynthesis protein